MAGMDESGKENQSNRREFISGRATMRALEQLADTTLGTSEPTGHKPISAGEDRRETYLTQ